MLLTMTQPFSVLEQQFFQKALTASDAILVTQQALHLALIENVYGVPGYARAADLENIGGVCHPSWTQVSEAQWLQLTCDHDKVVTW